MDKLVSGIAAGIGLASESITARKQAKKQPSVASDGDSNRDLPPPAYELEPSQPLEEGDEELLDLDETQDDLTPAAPLDRKPKQDAIQIIEAFIRRFPAPEFSEHNPPSQLQFPVILPQRRPKDRSRGFIRAYAPDLDNCGIDQAMFLAFLDTFQKSSEASPWLQAINMAQIGTLFMPTVAGILVSMAIQASVQIAMDVQSRSRTNTFLDKINDEFFRPRGLYCLVMTWDPDSAVTHSSIDVTSTITASLNHSGGMDKIKNNLRSSSGTTYGEVDFPQAAPLIFPALDNLAGQTGEEAIRKRDKIKKKANFVDEYYDRRAQAKYAGEHPDSALAQGPKPTFTSRYADPNHPASSGNPISLVTGGYINPPSLGSRGSRGGFGWDRRGLGGGLGGGLGALLGDARGGFEGRTGSRERLGRDRWGGRAGIDRYGYAEDPHERRGGGLGTRGQGITGLEGLPKPSTMVKRVLKKNVVYLMIVNMPSDAEMAAARAATEQKR